MKKILNTLFLAVLLGGSGCDEYDDSRILQDLDEVGSRIEALEKAVEDLNTQLGTLSQLVGSSFISLISTDASGNYVVTYVDDESEHHTITLATEKEVVTLPILGAAQDDGKWYWRQTTDNGQTWTWLLNGGERIEVGGETPVVGIDDEGYWTVNGNPVTDDKGAKVLADDVSNRLFSEVRVDDTTGEAVFTLADGTELRMRMFEALGIRFDKPVYSAVPDHTTRVRVDYTIVGSQAEGAIVDIFTAYNLTTELDTSVGAIFVTLNEGAAEGNLLVMAHAGGNTVLKPLFFTLGDAVIEKPLYNGSTADIVLEGQMTQFEVTVSASIDYEVSVSDESASWLVPMQTRALTSTVHRFTADYYENPTGEVRTGEIRFVNHLYDVSASILVKQSPAVPEGGGGGIASATDLMGFAAAVNAGVSTARWENEAGEVILLNDIDMSAVDTWTPIGSIGNSFSSSDGFTTVNPFRGVFDGKGFAVKNLHYTTDMSAGKIGHAFFGALDGATVRNLTLGDPQTEIAWTFTGKAPVYTVCASLAAYAVNSTIESCTNYYNIDFTGDNASGELCMASGLVGAIKNTTIGGRAKSLGCENYGFVRTGVISNNDNGGSGMHTAGICAYMTANAGNLLQYCVNRGHISCPTGRTGGLVATMANGNIKNSDNRGLIEDDLAGKFVDAPTTSYDRKRMGGLVGGTADLRTTPSATVESCTNYGDVYTHIGCRTGGFVGHSNVQIIGCANEGSILGDVVMTGHGPGWACGYAAASTQTWTNVRSCTMGGRVGSYTEYKDKPAEAPVATADNAFAYANERFDPSINN